MRGPVQKKQSDFSFQHAQDLGVRQKESDLDLKSGLCNKIWVTQANIYNFLEPQPLIYKVKIIIDLGVVQINKVFDVRGRRSGCLPTVSRLSASRGRCVSKPYLRGWGECGEGGCGAHGACRSCVVRLGSSVTELKQPLSSSQKKKRRHRERLSDLPSTSQSLTWIPYFPNLGVSLL